MAVPQTTTDIEDRGSQIYSYKPGEHVRTEAGLRYIIVDPIFHQLAKLYGYKVPVGMESYAVVLVMQLCEFFYGIALLKNRISTVAYIYCT